MIVARIKLSGIQYNTAEIAKAVEGAALPAVRELLAPLPAELEKYIQQDAAAGGVPFNIQMKNGAITVSKKNGSDGMQFSGKIVVVLSEYQKESWSPNYSSIDVVQLFNYGYTASAHVYAPFTLSKGRQGQTVLKRIEKKGSAGSYSRMPSRLHRDGIYFIQSGVSRFLAANPFVSASISEPTASYGGKSHSGGVVRPRTKKGKRFDKKKKTNRYQNTLKLSNKSMYLVKWSENQLGLRPFKQKIKIPKYKASRMPEYDLYSGIKHYSKEWYEEHGRTQSIKKHENQGWFDVKGWRYR